MKNSKSLGFFRPFKDLESLLKKRNNKIASSLQSPQKSQTSTNTGSKKSASITTAKPIKKMPKDDKTLFLEAMSDVKPISRKNIVEKKNRRLKMKFSNNNGDGESLSKLNRLIHNGEGFSVSNTSEYMEGTGYNVHPEISKRLHKGRFSIQAHIDLHGLTVVEAEEAFNVFIKDSIMSGLRALLVIHGRGLSSPGKPILKSKVYEWLTLGPWRKWVIAFSSARPFDGGAGATYILLRKSPLTKRYKKRKQS